MNKTLGFVLIALLGTGLGIQTKRHADTTTQLASAETKVQDYESRLTDATKQIATKDAEAQNYESRLAESAQHMSTLQARLDKLIAYRDKRFALALSLFKEASDAADAKHESFTRAYAIWSELEEAGDTRANYHMGMMNMFGIGGANFDQYDGVKNIRIAAEGGYPIAQSFMGFMVERSDGTMVRSGDELALSWWTKGAEGNHCPAVRRMVKIYENGELGVDADAAKAAEWKARTKTCSKT